jgi:oxygen-dependent protoporphyrinogen oxidase
MTFVSDARLRARFTRCREHDEAHAVKRHFVVLGAGMAGLVAAVTLARRGADVTVLEARHEPGGTIRTLRMHGCVADAGPEALVGTHPDALAFCESLGISDRMVSPDESMGTWLARRSGPVALPEGLAMGIPRRVGQLATTPALSWTGKLRATLDLVLPPRHEPALGPLIDRRFGREVKEHLVEPLFGGIYATDVDRLETAFVAPHLAHARGSLVRALSKERGASRGSVLRAPLGGMRQLVDALVSSIGRERIRLGAGATQITRNGHRWRVEATGSQPLDADDVVIAMPSRAAASIARTMNAPLAILLATLRAHSTASVVLGYDASEVHLPRLGGVFLPRGEAGALLGATIVSNRWPHSAPAGTVLIRALVGGARAPDLVDSVSDDLIARGAHDKLAELLPLRAPRWQHVVRYPASQVSPVIGHMRMVAAARDCAKGVGGVHLVGAAYDGGGIAGILARAERSADELLG